MLNRSHAPSIKDAIEYHIELKKPDQFKLDNGVNVYNVQAGTEEVVQIEWVFKAGNWFEEKKLVASATNFLIKNGTTKKSAYEINEFVDFYGAYLNRSCYNETAVVSLHCLTKQLEHILPLVQEIFLDATMPEDELLIYKQNMKQRLAVNLKKCDFIAGRKIDALLFGEKHPYGVYSEMDDYDAIQQDELIRYYQSYYKNGHCTIFSAGILPANYQQLLNKYFGHLPFNKNQVTNISHPMLPSSQKKWNILNDPDGVQGAIRIARPCPLPSDPVFPKLQVLNVLFGGFFGSRLMANIREDKGYTYGIGSAILESYLAGSLIIATEVGSEFVEPTLNEIKYEFERLKNEEVPLEELNLVKNYLLGQLLKSADGPNAMMDLYMNVQLHGLGFDYFENLMKRVNEINSKDLMRIANKYLDFEKFTIITAGCSN